MTREIHISKSKYLNGLQCPKLLWTWYNNRELIPEPDAAQQHIFDTGHEVGDLAKLLYPSGVEVVMNFGDLGATVRDTAALVNRSRAERVPIFEASFLVEGRYCRVDVLVPVPETDQWDLVEVKSSTRVKDVNVNDVAFQHDALTRAGIDLRDDYLMHVNTGYVRGEEFDVRQFFALDNITSRVAGVLQYVPSAVDKMLGIIGGPDPDTPIGRRCHAPYTCPLIPHCWAGLPDHNVTELYYGGTRSFELLDDGLFTIATVPDNRLSPQQRIQKQTIVTGQLHTEPAHLRAWLDELVYPLYHLDFETMNPALPPFVGTRPYQRLPFQFSLHIQRAPGAEPEHVEFIHRAHSDPRPDLTAALHAIGDEGTILAWNMGFEKGVLNDLAELYPAEAEWLAGLNERMMDLIVPFKRFWFHHPGQHGSCSLKAVLPAITTLGYDDLAIADGNHAAHAYADAMFHGAEAADREQVLQQLLAYCRQDTLAMVEILRVIEAAAG